MTDETFQVVFVGVMKPQLEEWLDSRGLYLARLPLAAITGEESDLPTYVIGIKDARSCGEREESDWVCD